MQTTFEEILAAIHGIPENKHLRFFVVLAHELTISARGTYVIGSHDLKGPVGLRGFNEIIHKILGVAKALTTNSKHYPYDVLMREVWQIAEEHQCSEGVSVALARTLKSSSRD